MRNRLLLLVLLVSSLASAAKDQPLVAILVYPGKAGIAYAQYSDFAINGKRELYTCASKPLTGNEYKRATKLLLAPGMVLNHEADGALSLAGESRSTCVLPPNAKVEGGRTYQLKDIVDLAMISGAAVASSNAGPQPPTTILPGMQIYILASPDTEYAEYLRAMRASSIPVWSDYLKLYAGSTHGAQARKSLAALIVSEGERSLDDYRKAATKGPQDFEKLRKARIASEDANRVLPANPGAEKLRLEVESELQKVLAAGRDELNAYVTAVNEHTAGYDHLGKAQAYLQNVGSVDAAFPPADKLKGELLTQSGLLADTIAAAEEQVAGRRFDQAYAIAARYKGFAAEVPRIAAVIDEAFRYRRDRGAKAMQDGNWEAAIAEFRKALEYNNDPAVGEQLKQAAARYQQSVDTEAVTKAVTDSQALAGANQFIEAYQILEALPERQRASAAEEMEKLKKPYLEDLTRRSANLLRVHTPIRGRADENGVRQALDYLGRVSRLSDDEAVKLKLDLSNDKIAEYYLKEAERLFQKPRGSGLGLGWLFLKEAEKFKPDNETLRNQLTRYKLDYETHAKLSVSIRFRDQTQRRGFADQLADTAAAGLENSGLPGIKVVVLQRQGDTESDLAAPTLANFLILGDIVNHRVEKTIDSQPLTSRFRAGHREVKNPVWIEQKRAVDSLQQAFDTSKIAAANAAASKNKKQAAEAAAAMEKAGKELNQARAKLDVLPETKLEDIIQPYNYIRRTVNLSALVEASFRVTDAFTQTQGPSDTVKMELPKSFVVLENVKPEDVDGVVEEGTMPDENQLLAEAEAKVQTDLVAKLVQQLTAVPAKVLEDARAAVSRGDSEGAAEKYLLYLNATPAKATPERVEAQQFLRNEFNITTLTVQ